jgi:hypothetical protein
MREQLDKLNELAGKHARLILVEFKMPLVPTWVLVTRNYKLSLVPTPWQDDEQKYQYADAVRALMREKHVLFYSFVTEAWAATLEPGEWDEESGQPRDGVRPAERPDRQEIVIACAASKDLVRWRQWRIVREATTERIVDLVQKPFPGSDERPLGWVGDMLK